MGKGVIFFGFIWLLTCIAGGVMSGQVPSTSTVLTADINDSVTTIPVASTEGFPEPGIIIIEGERISYSSTTATTIKGNTARPLVRGSGDSTAVPHSSGETVRTKESALINNAVDYNLAIISDATGLMAFIQMPVAVFNILKTFVATPFGFLGTDLAIITAIWGIAMLGLIVSIIISMTGGRRI